MTQAPPQVCTHHWVIEPPTGRESFGRCSNCGDERVFQNVPSQLRYERMSAGSEPYRNSVRSSWREEVRLSDQ